MHLRNSLKGRILNEAVVLPAPLPPIMYSLLSCTFKGRELHVCSKQTFVAEKLAAELQSGFQPNIKAPNQFKALGTPPLKAKAPNRKIAQVEQLPYFRDHETISTHSSKFVILSLISFSSSCQTIFTVWLSNSTLKFNLAFKALNTLRIVSNLASVRLFSSFDICAF